MSLVLIVDCLDFDSDFEKMIELDDMLEKQDIDGITDIEFSNFDVVNIDVLSQKTE